jgi:preprotein translocase subunit Sec61beta
MKLKNARRANPVVAVVAAAAVGAVVVAADHAAGRR